MVSVLEDLILVAGLRALVGSKLQGEGDMDLTMLEDWIMDARLTKPIGRMYSTSHSVPSWIGTSLLPRGGSMDDSTYEKWRSDYS
jgi:hypothetical protein